MPEISDGKRPPGIYHQLALSNEFLLRVATGTSFLTIRIEDCERFELTVP
jgi:hypothetical protein